MTEQKFETELEFERSTKRTFRFRETNEPVKIGVLYVKKAAFASQPKRIRVSVEVLE